MRPAARLVPIALLAVLVVMAPLGAAVSNPYLDLSWTRSPLNPVLTNGTAGSWDALQVIAGPVVYANGMFRMWYAGSGDNLASGLGTATSTDGIHWVQDPANPILTETIGGSVLYEGGGYKMWYTHIRGTAYGVPWTIDYSTSTDGIRWSPGIEVSGLNVSATGWDSYTIAAGPVVHDASGYRMWYGATADQMTWSVGLATSTDGVHWMKYADNPVLTPPFAGAWDNFRVQPTCVLQTSGGLVMWYVGDSMSLVQRIGVAVSTDGIHWTPSPTPALNLGASGSWDGTSLSRATVLQMGNQLDMWYTGTGAGSSSGQWEIGLATAPAGSLAPGGTSPTGGLSPTALATIVIGIAVVTVAVAVAGTILLARRQRPPQPPPYPPPP